MGTALGNPRTRRLNYLRAWAIICIPPLTRHILVYNRMRGGPGPKTRGRGISSGMPWASGGRLANQRPRDGQPGDAAGATRRGEEPLSERRESLGPGIARWNQRAWLGLGGRAGGDSEAKRGTRTWESRMHY